MDAVTFQTEAMRCERLMYHVGYSILHNDQDCADAVQEALTRAWQKQHTLRSPSRFRPWLMKILVNTCRDILRQRQKIRFVPLEEQILAGENYDEVIAIGPVSPCRSGNASISSGPNGASPCFCTIWKDSPSLRLPIRWACRRARSRRA